MREHVDSVNLVMANLWLWQGVMWSYTENRLWSGRGMFSLATEYILFKRTPHLHVLCI